MQLTKPATGQPAAPQTHSASPQATTQGAQQRAGSFLRRMSDTSDAESADEAHERAIRSCGLDVEHHMRLRDDAMREYARTGCFDAKGEADRQLALARDAAEMQRVLLANRAPRQADLNRAALQRGRGG